MPEQLKINDLVRHAYHDLDVNCAKTTLIALSALFDCPLEPRLLQAATGFNGAGRSRGQCGLVEGALMFMGVFFGGKGLDDEAVTGIAGRFAAVFKERFGSISCYDLRPGGFQKDDPRHKCEGLTVETIDFTARFIRAEIERHKLLA